MFDSTQTSVNTAFLFGPFEFYPTQRVLLRSGRRVRIGSRAREVLLALLENAGTIVKKRALIARVWPDIVVEDGTLRVHVSELRKLLGDEQHGPRYIENITGIGYRFSALVTRSEKLTYCEPPLLIPVQQPVSPPFASRRTIGRMETVALLAQRLTTTGFVTVVGPGGIGKTAIALLTANQLQGAYPHGIHFVDLAEISDGELIAPAVASVVGKDQRMLVVLDNCEHLAHDAAVVAEQLLNSSNVHVLATSREPLRARGEHVLRLEPLTLPQPGVAMTAAEALRFSAVELFVERSLESLDTFRFGDDDVAAVGAICRLLDGNPLAIEMAAANVAQFGLRGLASRLGSGSGLLGNSRRTAPRRQQTLQASLDWSYNLLSRAEQLALLRLAAFPGSFDIGSAVEVIVDEVAGSADVLDVLANLVSKSLVTAHRGQDPARYQLPHTLRAYALEKLEPADSADSFGCVILNRDVEVRELAPV